MKIDELESSPHQPINGFNVPLKTKSSGECVTESERSVTALKGFSNWLNKGFDVEFGQPYYNPFEARPDITITTNDSFKDHANFATMMGELLTEINSTVEHKNKIIQLRLLESLQVQNYSNLPTKFLNRIQICSKTSSITSIGLQNTPVIESIFIAGAKITTLKDLPDRIEDTLAIQACHYLTKIDSLPKEVCDDLVFTNLGGVTSIVGLEDVFPRFTPHSESWSRLGFYDMDVRYGGIGLLLIPDFFELEGMSANSVSFNKALHIIEEYLYKKQEPDDGGDLIYDCQRELLEANLDHFAEL